MRITQHISRSLSSALLPLALLGLIGCGGSGGGKGSSSASFSSATISLGQTSSSVLVVTSSSNSSTSSSLLSSSMSNSSIALNSSSMFSSSVTASSVSSAISSSSSSTTTSSHVTNSSAVALGWELVWSDEFDGSNIDTTKWSFEKNCTGGGNNELQCYTDRSDNAFVANGKLHLVAKKETFAGQAKGDDEPNYNVNDKSVVRDYTSARLRSKSKGDWKYGRFEIRAKMPQGQGIWPAIWMLPTEWKYGGWPLSGEIDIFEAVNTNTPNGGNVIHGTLHYGDAWPNNKYAGTSYTPTTNIWEQFHTYAVEWEEGEIRWYVDDKHFATKTNADWYTSASTADNAPFDESFHLIMNVAVGGNWPGVPNNATSFPQEMQVDSVKVYRCATNPKTGKGCANQAVPPVSSAASSSSSSVSNTLCQMQQTGPATATVNLATSSWATLHYSINGGSQLNVTMNQSGGNNSYVINGLSIGNQISYRCTYWDTAVGFARDTVPVNFTFGALSSSLASSSMLGSSRSSVGSSSSAASSVALSNITPLFDQNTALEPAIQYDRGDALVTRFSDRGRDRHAKENHFQAYDHYLTFYWEQRTAAIEIVDYVAKGGTRIEMKVRAEGLLDNAQAENRWWYVGRNTLAEYCGNGVMQRVTMPGDSRFHYYKQDSWNCREGRAIQLGDRLEFEVSQFLDKGGVLRGRDNYYGTTYLYIVGQGLVPWDVTDRNAFVGGLFKQRDTIPLPVSARLGGDTTLHVQMTAEPDGHFQQMANNLGYENGQPFVLGRRVHHASFVDGSHDENHENGLFTELIGKAGTRYINDRCSDCHERNGRAEVAGVGQSLDLWVFKVGDAAGNAHPMLGRVLQPEANGGATSEGEVVIASWTETNGLRKPNYQFSGVQPETFSARLAPQLVGMGLLEAIPEAAILANEDVNDSNSDGISGKARRVLDPVTGKTRLGRFGYKAGTGSLKHQIAAAFNTDMGVMTSVMPNPDCGANQTNCGPNGAELANEHLDNLVKYIALLGVRGQRDYNNPEVIQGKAIFAAIGCQSCHTASFVTSEFAALAELRNQLIQPYTDMLLHDMGQELADSLGEGEASGAEWRTAPLWGLGVSACVTGGVTGLRGNALAFGLDGQEVCVPKESYLHDGRARTIDEAIRWHGGEGANSRANYNALSSTDKAALQAFLKSL